MSSIIKGIFFTAGVFTIIMSLLEKDPTLKNIYINLTLSIALLIYLIFYLWEK